MHAKQVQSNEQQNTGEAGKQAQKKNVLKSKLVRLAVKYTVLAVTSALSTFLQTLMFVVVGGRGRGSHLPANMDALINSVCVVLIHFSR